MNIQNYLTLALSCLRLRFLSRINFFLVRHLHCLLFFQCLELLFMALTNFQLFKRFILLYVFFSRHEAYAFVYYLFFSFLLCVLAFFISPINMNCSHRDLNPGLRLASHPFGRAFSKRSLERPESLTGLDYRSIVKIKIRGLLKVYYLLLYILNNLSAASFAPSHLIFAMFLFKELSLIVSTILLMISFFVSPGRMEYLTRSFS